MIRLLLAFGFGVIFYLVIRKWGRLGFISCHAVVGVMGVTALGLMTGELSRFQDKVLIYFVLWSWWVFFSSVIEHSLTLKILDSLGETQLLKTYDMNDEFILRVEKLVRSRVVVKDESNNLYCVKTSSHFYRYDSVLKRLFRVESGSLY